MSKITGAQMVLKCLEREKVEVVFGYPGAAIMPLYDAIIGRNIRHILVRHEQCAAHAADGYARATGKIGVCIATSGPGVTNLITGIANAYMDSIPMIAITGQVSSDLIGTDAFQETDTIGVTSPITKHSYLVLSAKEIPSIIKEAFHIASTGRPGPVVIDLPIDIQVSLIDENTKINIELPGYKPTYKGNLLQIKQAAHLLSNSKKPVFFTGGGVIASGASDILLKFANKFKIPVINTLLGLGCFPEKNTLFSGMAGMCGMKHTNLIFSKTDLIIAIGVRFSNRTTGKLSEFAPQAKIIHIEIDPAEIGKNIIPDVPIVGDARIILDNLYKECARLIDTEKIQKQDEWLKTVSKLKKNCSIKYDKISNSLKPGYIIEKIYEVTEDDAIICTDVGQHQIWTAKFYKFNYPRTFITSGGLGTMGFGLPASIGAKIGKPDKQVIYIAGDGSIQMVLQELATAVINKLPIKIMILNNGYLGMVRQLQQIVYDGRYSQVDIRGSVDFVKLIEAYGGIGFRVKNRNEVESTIRKAFEIDNVVLIDFCIDREENILPIAKPGASIGKMIESK